METIVLTIYIFIPLVFSLCADEPYPPPGFPRAETKRCAEGGFLLVNHAKSPGAFTAEPQIWL